MVALQTAMTRLRWSIALLLCLTLSWGIVQQPTLASSHREAPLIAGDPLADNTDVYAFRSYEPGREDTVTLLWNHIPLEPISGGPQFYPFGDDVLYDIKVNNRGDGGDDITYRFKFQTEFVNKDSVLGMVAPNQDGVISTNDDPDFNQRQRYTVTEIRRGFMGMGQQRKVLGRGLLVPPSNIGSRATPNYENLASQAVYTLNNGYRVFAGQRSEGFYVDLGGVFDVLNFRSISDTGGRNTTGKFSVNTLAIEVPIKDLTRNRKMTTNPTDPNAVIGVYSTASRCATKISSTGNCSKPIQVSRLGSPLVNEVVIPLGLKDKFNASEPENDAQFAQFVVDPQLPKLMRSVFGITIPPAPRNDLVAIFATGIPANSVPGAPQFTTFLSDGKPHELLRLNTAIPPTPVGQQNRLGLLGGDLAGFPNGRRVIDDVVDIELRAVAGGTPFTPATNVAPNNTLGDGVDRPSVPFLDRFPYLGTPLSGNPPPKTT
ncbi:DUF4331 domain-containing protein [Phormidesmis sp. 146-12]